MNIIEIQICDSPNDAPNYNTDGKGFKGAKLIKAIVVRKGTKGGHDTIDLQFEDENGQKYIALTTAAILKTLIDVVEVRR